MVCNAGSISSHLSPL
ncbi:hypothetical protein BpHYR1_031191 [Brachionus plicatilis]|uniref:Uncharacterized protein n=1 Tax=Brachionus plicatilis TaxID=10195 RepID=A0A3M7R1D3_BRAPC|nr:hypothetical protein BpHYR1_031191 [Brachionus plicatilis]